jgi:hypothetical protein
MCLYGGSYAQQFQLQYVIPFDAPASVSIDQSGSIYAADAMGNLFKYTPAGEYVVEYSPERPARITDLEAWQGLRIFLFYRDRQEYTFLNRFLTAQGTYSFDPGTVGFVEAAAPSADNNVWLFDQSDFSLKKYSLQLREVVLRTPLDLLLDPNDYKIATIREYQNKVYMGDMREGVLVFDNLGNYLKTISAPGVRFYSLYGHTLYLVRDRTLLSIDIYTGARETRLLPETASWQFAFRYEERLYLASDSQIAVYK